MAARWLQAPRPVVPALLLRGEQSSWHSKRGRVTRRVTLGRRPSYRLCPAVASALASWRPGTGTPQPGGRCTGCTPGSRSCCSAGSDSDRHGNGAATSAVAGQLRSLSPGRAPLTARSLSGVRLLPGRTVPGARVRGWQLGSRS